MQANITRPRKSSLVVLIYVIVACLGKWRQWKRSGWRRSRWGHADASALYFHRVLTRRGRVCGQSLLSALKGLLFPRIKGAISQHKQVDGFSCLHASFVNMQALRKCRVAGQIPAHTTQNSSATPKKIKPSEPKEGRDHLWLCGYSPRRKRKVLDSLREK